MKRDLNLIPKTEASPVFTKYVLPILLLVVLYASTGYMAWSIPSETLHARESENSVLAQKVDDLAYVEIEYQNLRAQINAIEAKKQTIAQTTSTTKSAHYILQLIENASPADLVLTTIELADDGLNIVGYAPTDTIIAEFVVNLRSMARFEITNISSVAPQAVSFEETQEAQLAGVDIQELRAFALSVSYSEDSETAEGVEGEQ